MLVLVVVGLVGRFIHGGLKNLRLAVVGDHVSEVGDSCVVGVDSDD